ncbi:unnamed protein product [Rotaria magnacalcarata]|uniref:Uncharacterized protein n=1 Tax=Rotaria magnacalcarata TaxID=392030 RepID=A0A815RS15_9BILA|nr:unnamed protein product [Rotaria magnacalcarata]CAF4437262.1 unnamed protein product [Rotaria magnacalcarata]CAF4542033.1 unnamed protein product [Rotaria magnacalcarata]
MVLQRAPQRGVVWGFGDTTKLTTLRFNDKNRYNLTLDPVSDEGPYDIQVTQPLANGTHATITLHDVLFRDVWICSGQSNMQMAVIDIFNAT